MLSQTYTLDRLKRILLPREAWHPYPTVDERAPWEALPEAVRKAHIAKGEACLGFPWEPFRATLFLEMARTGSRALYERRRARHRTALCDLVIAECVEGKGRFMDDIVDGVWAACEESFWGKPFTLYMQKAGFDLPDTTEPIVALFVAEAASLLAWTSYLLGSQLDGYSSLIRPRLEREMARRMLTPCLERDDFGWMGFKDRRVNNWNPWINSNWLTAALLVEADGERRLAAVSKSLRSLDTFIDFYPRDGGCDEGPGYWGHAGASLFDCLELLHSATDGAITVYDRPFIKDIGRFIYRVQIADRYFVNFADAPARLIPSPALVFRYGRRIDDAHMVALGAWAAQQQNVAETGFSGSIGRQLPALFIMTELTKATPRQPLPRDVWLPEIQVMTARDQEGRCEGFYVAAKGGHNAESHNHNDVGHFIVYMDGKPVIVDAGVEIYTGKTFSQQRYDIWTMQSDYHSLPTINGVMQRAGRGFAATEVSYARHEARARLCLDLARAYPPEAGLRSWVRTVTLERGREVRLEDTYELLRPAANLSLNLLSPCRIAIEEEGCIVLHGRALDADRRCGDAQIHYDADEILVSVQEIPLEVENLQHIWGGQLARMILKVKRPSQQGRLTLRFTR